MHTMTLLFNSAYTPPFLAFFLLGVACLIAMGVTAVLLRRGKASRGTLVMESVMATFSVLVLIFLFNSAMKPADILQRVAIANIASVDSAHAKSVIHALSESVDPGQPLRDWQAQVAMQAQPHSVLTSRDLGQAIKGLKPKKTPITQDQQCRVARYIAPAGMAASICLGDNSLADINPDEQAVPSQTKG